MKSSLDEGPKGQRRHIAVGKENTVYAMFGRRFGEEFRETEVTQSPTTDELPAVEPKRFTPREGVHVHHEHQPTLWTPKHASWKGDSPDRAGMTFIEPRGRMKGRANQKDWKSPPEEGKRHPRVGAKRRRAQRWAAKYG